LEDELCKLQAENDRLQALLEQHGIDWQVKPESRPTAPEDQDETPSVNLTPADKVALFRTLFRGRADVYPLRWESAKGTSGYSPACGNEWKPGICHKPRVKCGECSKRQLLPVTDQVIYDHLAGKQTIGIYPLMQDDHCHFLAVDFDKGEWCEDTKSFLQSCEELNIPASLEISRSGNGAHVWIFFSDAVYAREARMLGVALISHACSRTRQLSFASYDRLFPNQDSMPKGGFGNLIALPLQKRPREHDCSVFVDQELAPHLDQWAYLASVKRLSRQELESALLRTCNGRHPLDVAFVAEDEGGKPWQRPDSSTTPLSCELPSSLNVISANQIYFTKSELPQPLANRLVRLAAFQNPEFYKAQAMRMPVWNKPRIIGCAENYEQYIALPRGCMDSALVLLEQNGIKAVMHDDRILGKRIAAKFVGSLRKGQKKAVREMARHEVGVLCAPTAFGKTVTAAALVAKRKVSTLILVHRTDLLKQWQERLGTFLETKGENIGTIGGGKKKITGKIDIAVMQTLTRMDQVTDLLDAYGQIIVDECHHISAFSFETILRQAKAKFVLGLTATPIRRDGHQPIIHMQCGPVRYSTPKAETAPTNLEVWPRYLPVPMIPEGSAIQNVFKALAEDDHRNRAVINDVNSAYREGRKVLVLTERTDHLALLSSSLSEGTANCFLLHGRMSRKQRDAVLKSLQSLGESEPRILLATGRLIGEGFDHPALDTLVLAMPISWKGTLQQYAGRLHRDHAHKDDVRIYDYAELEHPQLARMWDKRVRGYRAMGYTLQEAGTTARLL